VRRQPGGLQPEGATDGEEGTRNEPHGPEKKRNRAVKRYERLENLLADPDVDLVGVCTPTYLHEPLAVAALRAGKHTLVEKAIARTPAAADAMPAARDAGRPGAWRNRDGKGKLGGVGRASSA
jgi:hypothetical protein